MKAEAGKYGIYGTGFSKVMHMCTYAGVSRRALPGFLYDLAFLFVAADS